MTPDDPLQALEAALDVRPSAGFAAGVRERVAQAGARPSRIRVFAWSGAAVAAVAMIVAIVAWPTRPAMAPARRAAPPEADARPAAPPAAASQVAVNHAAGPRRAVAGRGTPEARRSASRVQRPEPEVLIPKGQAQALNAFIAAVRRGDIDSRQFAAPVDPTVIDPIVIAPIVVAPLDTADGSAKDEAGAGGKSPH